MQRHTFRADPDLNPHRDVVELTYEARVVVQVPANHYAPASSLEAVRAIEADNLRNALIGYINDGTAEVSMDVEIVKSGALTWEG